MGPTGSGCFRSGKLGRLVEYQSTLELQVLRHLDRDPRVVAFVEQPLTVPYVLDEKAHEYTPDVAVLLDDRSVFLIEIKPASMLGGFDVAMKLAALARFCGQNGYGLYAGSPDCGLLDFRALQPDPAASDLVREDLENGPITGRSFKDLASLIRFDGLSVLAAANILDWRSNRRRIAHPHPADKAEVLRFWALVDKHKPLPPQSVAAASRAPS